MPIEPGVSAGIGGEIRSVIAGRYLYLSARLPEPSGRMVARSIGLDPVWEGGGEARSLTAASRVTYGAPEGEDFVRFVIRVYNENDWAVQVGPLGGYSVKWRWTGERDWYNSDPKKCDRFLVASQVDGNEWRVEAALPLDQLGSPRPGYVRLSVERNRAERPGTPEEWWRWPSDQPTSDVAMSTLSGAMPDPGFQAPTFGNTEPPIQTGRKSQLPPLDSSWTDPEWRNVPVWTLRQNERAGRLPHFPTEIKLMHDGHTLAVMARCIEPGAIVANAKERDESIDRDDSIQVYLATSGSSYAQYAINPLGYVLGAAGHQGGPRLSEPHPEWNSPVRSFARKDGETWIARLDLPLDSASAVLGDAQLTRHWRILVMRYRPERDGEPQETSVLPVTQSTTPFCPARYRRLELVDQDPSALSRPPLAERTGDLAFLPSRVFSPEQRKKMQLSSMLENYIRARVLKILEAEKRDWDQVKSVSDWEHFRDPRLRALKTSLGKFPEHCPLNTRVTSDSPGEGYHRQNLVFQSQPGVWVTANLYLPAERRSGMPGILILHSLHAPKTQFELQDMGIIWARAGCAVLVIDQIGYGERIENYPWDRDNYNSRYITGEQLYLTGSSLITWMVWDAMRAIDLLYERDDVDKKKIILLGAVAGGGDPAAVTAALDSRVAAVVPFNFGECTPEVPRFIPEKNQWPLDLADPGLDDWDTTRVMRRAIIDQFMQWFICASVAPRRFVYSYELGWNVEDLPAWSRYRKVFGFYNAVDYLADAHGFGPFPGPGEAWNIGPAQRRSLYPTLEKWFGIPIPFTEAKSSEYENVAARPAIDRRPVSELAALNPAVASELHIRTVHEIAREQGEAEVKAVRTELAGLPASERRKWMQTKWMAKLGDVEPNRNAVAKLEWTKQIPNAQAEGISLSVEPGIMVPLILLRPPSHGAQPVVVAVSEGGNDLFLEESSNELEGLLKNGIAVCLPDVRGTGETSPDRRRDPDGGESIASNSVLMYGETLLGERLKDLRTVLAYLETRHDLDSTRIGLWGDSLAQTNPERLLLDELPQWQIGPSIEQQAEPLGGLLVLLAGLYENNVHAIAVHGGLVSFSSILNDSFGYVPQDVVVPGILDAGDVADVAATLAPRCLLLNGLVDGRNRKLSQEALKQELQSVYASYGDTPGCFAAQPTERPAGFTDWFVRYLR
jgi:dienelactone hydrolase